MINLKRSKKPPFIPMSSMSDIGFLLLIFIMLISLINQRHEVKIDYSEAKVLERTQEPENLEIWVERNGRISVDGKVVALDDLEQLIAGTLAYQPSARVHVIADRNTPYRHVNAIVGILQTLQHRVVSFVVREEL
jgi:biopolymer transport protein ExbD